MAKITVKVVGLSELGQALKGLSEKVGTRIIRKAVRDSANKLRDEARGIVVSKGLVDEGRLESAIAARRMSKKSRPGQEFAAVGVFKVSSKKKSAKHPNEDPPEKYWKYVEFGTVKKQGRPFLVPAFNQTKMAIPGIMADVIDQGIKRETKRLAKLAKKAQKL